MSEGFAACSFSHCQYSLIAMSKNSRLTFKSAIFDGCILLDQCPVPGGIESEEVKSARQDPSKA
jgi:hypothetical protein